MKLHIVAGSPNCHKIEAVIDHLGLEVEIVEHDLPELAAPDYVALNANAMVPTLADGAFTLWESNAIMQYLADKAGSNSLFPRDPRHRADIARWQFWELVHFNRALGTLAFEIVARPRLNMGQANSNLVAMALADLARFAPVLERHLTGRRYLVGDDITLADYAVVTFESYRQAVPFDWRSYPNINAYFDRMKIVDHWARTGIRDRSSVRRAPRAPDALAEASLRVSA